MADLTKDQLTTLARLGAQTRLAELVVERQAILAAFPDLTGPRKPGRPAKVATAPAAKPARKQYRMSAANRKAQAERMRAYWAARRQEKQAGERGAEVAQVKSARRARKAAKGRGGKSR